MGPLRSIPVPKEHECLSSYPSARKNMLRILLADDHDLTRAGLRYLLEKQKDWSVCGEAPSGRMAVELAEQLRPDIAILDMTMPELNGVEATRQILKKSPHVKILIYTMH